MSRTKANATLQARLGFQDLDLITPAHDEMLLWLIENAQLIGERFFKLPRNWTEDPKREWSHEVKIARGHRFFKPCMIHKQQAELPVTNGSGSTFTVGFVDYYVEYFKSYRYDLEVIEKKWHSPEHHYLPAKNPQQPWDREQIITKAGYWTESSKTTIEEDKLEKICYFEIKPVIRSLGELLRQLQFYKTYLPSRAALAVVSDDLRFRAPIEGQDFYFIAPQDVEALKAKELEALNNIPVEEEPEF